MHIYIYYCIYGTNFIEIINLLSMTNYRTYAVMWIHLYAALVFPSSHNIFLNL